MELSNTFRVGVPVEHAWAVLTDVEQIAPCMPGAQLEEVEGDVYRGNVKVKVGPITAQYKGTARMVTLDPVAHRAVLRAEGRDTRGQGNASATVTATLNPDGSGTSVSVVTDLTVTGKVAQFGRGVLAEVSSKLIGQFVEALERDVLSDAPAARAEVAAPASAENMAAAAETAAPTPGPPAAAAPAATPAVEAPARVEAPAAVDAGPATNGSEGRPALRQIEHPESDPVDLLAHAGPSVAKRVIPVVAVLLILLLIGRSRRRS